MAKASKAQRQARALCVELARVTGNRPMQYRMVRPIVIAAGLDDADADAAIAYAVEKGWLTTDVAEDESGRRTVFALQTMAARWRLPQSGHGRANPAQQAISSPLASAVRH